jgi:hypothetical protein
VNVERAAICRQLQLNIRFVWGSEIVRYHGNVLLRGGKKCFFEQKPAMKALKPEITA